jgi:hypothetical protein
MPELGTDQAFPNWVKGLPLLPGWPNKEAGNTSRLAKTSLLKHDRLHFFAIVFSIVCETNEKGLPNVLRSICKLWELASGGGGWGGRGLSLGDLQELSQKLITGNPQIFSNYSTWKRPAAGPVCGQ